MFSLLDGLVSGVGKGKPDETRHARTSRNSSEGQFRALFEAAPNGVMAVDAAGRITLLNTQAEKMFGYSRRELIGETIDALVPQRFRRKHADLRKRAAANLRIRPMGTGRVFPALRKDGSEFPVEVGLNPIRMSTGQIIVVSVVDVTQRMSRGQRSWPVKTIAAIVLVFCLVIAAALTPLMLDIPKTIFALDKQNPAEHVEAAYTAYHKGRYAAALQRVRPIAEQGNSRAQSLLGLIYLKQQNAPEAMNWYRRAADQGDTDAQLKIGDMYSEGLGVPQDFSEAVRWYRLAADHGNAVAQYNLGVLYARGDGVPPDNVLAHMWFNLAAARFTAPMSRDRAIASRDAIAKKLSPDEIAKAQQLARDWKSSP